MKHLKLFFALFAMLALGVGNAWAEEVYFEGFEENHRTSGSNSYTASAKTYGDWTLTYADAVTSGSPLTGTAHIIMRVAKNTTNSPSLVSKALLSDKVSISKVSWNCKGNTAQTLKVSYSTNGNTWTEKYSAKLTTSKANKSFTLDNVPGPIYLKFVVSVASSTGSNRDANIDDITIEGTALSTEEPVVKTLNSIAVEGMTTEYEIGDVFEFDGTCTATYSVTQNGVPQEDETAVVVPTNVTEPDMSTAGTKEITVTYTEGEITKTVPYEITVENALPKIVITQNEVAEFTNNYAEYTWTASGVSGKIYGYKNSGMQFNSSKTGSYVYNTDPIPGYIRKIKIVKASGTTRNWTPSISETVLTSAGGTTLDQKEVAATTTWEVTGENSYFYLLESGGATVIESITIYYEAVVPQVAAPTFTPAAGTYNAVQNVTISAEAGTTIYYTLDGTDPTTASNVYASAIEISETTTVKAIAVKDEKVSPVASATYTIKLPLTTMDQIFAKATAVGSTATPVDITMNNWVVTGVKNSNAYVTDGTKGLIIYTASHGFNVGDILSGTVACKVQLFKGSAELTELTSTAEGLTVSSGGEVTPVEVADISSLTGANTGSVIKITGVHDKNNIISGVKLYNALYEFNDLTSGKKYSVTGVYLLYEETQEILPRSEADIVEVPVPTLSATITNADFGKIAINGKAERTLTLNGSLLTKPVSLAIVGDYFELEFDEVTPTEGKIENAKIKITYKPTAEDTHTATLKITSDDVAEQTITLTGQAVQQHTVHFFVNDEEQADLAKKVLSGNTLEEIPTATSCDLLNYPTFAGWTSAAIEVTTDVKPTMLDLSTPITSDCYYYAVFEKATVGGSSEEQTETITIENFKSSGDGEKRTCETNSATWTWLKNNASSPISVTYEEIRLYQYHSMTISQKDGCDISKIVANVSESKYATPFAGELSGAEKTPDGNNITLTPTSGDIVIKQLAQSRVNSFVVTYTTSTTTYEYITSCAVVVPTCEITYDYADGEGECTNDIVEEGAEYTLCSTAPTKAGHTFLNWKDQNGVEYAVGATITSVTEDLTLTAQWQVNSYEVTWMSLGDEFLVNNAHYNTQPTKPTTAPSYTCGIGSKEFVGWTTQEIDGVGVPANLYTDEFPVVTEAITYHAVFASKIEGGSMAKAVSLTNGETVYLATESGIGVTGANTSTNKDATVSTTQGDWLPFTVVTNGLQYQFKNGDNYITAAAKSFKITETPSDFAFENGYIVYNVPDGADKGDYVLLVNNNDAINTYYRFYKESNMSNSKYETFYVYKNPTHTDYTTSCPVLELTEGENTLTDGVTADVKVNRSFTTGNLYTISLPFALDAAQVNNIFGTGTALYQFAQLAKEGEELVLYFSKPSAIAAATPYLIAPAQNVTAGFIVEDATISTIPNNISFTVGATTVTMKPILSATAGEKTNGSTEYWLAADEYLYNNANTLLSLRALFNISTVSGMPPRCRVALDENVETGVEDIITTDAPVKVIENGQLIIIRDGVKYNVQGQKL